MHLVPGTEVKASLLRDGHSATVTRIESRATQTPLEVGMKISVGSRQDDGRHWSLILPDGEQLLLDHSAADAVTVLLDQ